MSTSRVDNLADQIVIIRKMLALEARKGFQDTAVSGGFERYFVGLEHRISVAESPSARISGLIALFDGYGSLEPSERQQRVKRALTVLGSPPNSESPSARLSKDVSTKSAACPCQTEEPAKTNRCSRSHRVA